MTTNRSIASVTPVLLLIVALALVGSQTAEGTKPEPEGEWQVTIPSCDSPADGGFNLCGRLTTTYTDTGDDDGLAVDVDSDRDRETKLEISRFTLVVLNCDWGEPCALKVPDQITLRSVEFVDYVVGGGPYCIFPEEEPGCPSDPPACLACFVNGEHPYREYSVPPYYPQPEDYTWFYFRVAVPGEFEEIQHGETVVTEGQIDIMIRGHHEYLPVGDEDFHFVPAYGELPDVVVTITRNGDAWTVEAVGPMTFYEGYRGCSKRNPQGDCVGGWEYIYPLWGGSHPLTLKATWSKTP